MKRVAPILFGAWPWRRLQRVESYISSYRFVTQYHTKMPDKRKGDKVKDDQAAKKSKKSSSGDKEKSKKSAGSAKEKLEKKTYPRHIQDDGKEETEEAAGFEITAKPPKRNDKGELVFEDFPEFRPNMTPKEVLQAGSFGGTYYRPIYSSITGKKYSGVWKELPKDWLTGLNIAKQVSSSVYDEKVNTYKAKCGGSLEMWETSGWIHKQDPYGWFMWFCRFYQGRRTEDDERQIGRWLRCAGVTGRWRNNLISKCARSGCAYDNVAVSPVVRQTLQHWGYKLTKEHFDAYVKKMKKKGQI